MHIPGAVKYSSTIEESEQSETLEIEARPAVYSSTIEESEPYIVAHRPGAPQYSSTIEESERVLDAICWALGGEYSSTIEESEHDRYIQVPGRQGVFIDHRGI